jgi:hypothetical protein
MEAILKISLFRKFLKRLCMKGMATSGLNSVPKKLIKLLRNLMLLLNSFPHLLKEEKHLIYKITNKN